jgi:hypothetical protein
MQRDRKRYMDTSMPVSRGQKAERGARERMVDRRTKCNRRVAGGRVSTGQSRRRAGEQRRHPKCERNGNFGEGGGGGRWANEAQRKMKQANEVKEASCGGD